MKLFFASLAVVLALSIAAVSAVDGTPSCHEFHKSGDDGDIEVLYTDNLSSFDSLLAHSDYSLIGAVSGPCSECNCDIDKFSGLVLDPGCEETEHSFRDAAGAKTILDISYKCEYEVPTVTVCTKTLSFDGKKATSSWKTSEQPIINRQRNLRAGRHLSDVEVGSVSTGACDETRCAENCPLELIDHGITYARDEDACADNPVRGKCTYTNDTDEDNETPSDEPDEPDPEPCTESNTFCLVEDDSFELSCDAGEIEACDLDIDGCQVMEAAACTCDDLCSGEGQTCTPKGTTEPIDSWKCHVEKEEKPEKDLSSAVCKKLYEDTFEEVTLEVVVDEPRNTWRLGECKDPKNERFYCKKYPMKYDSTNRIYYCDPSRR